MTEAGMETIDAIGADALASTDNAGSGRIILRTTELTKRYKTTVAVDNLNLDIYEGEVFGLLGPNGAGKTTTILMLLGLTEPTSGRAEIDGLDCTKQTIDVKRFVGYLPDNVGFYNDMTGMENLLFTADLNSIDKKIAVDRASELVERVKLADVAGNRVGTYSRGMRQRLAIADILMKDPKLIILDEPTVGLDPRQIIEIRALIKKLGADHTVVLSSHILHEVADVCERVVIINRGRIVAQDSLEQLTTGINDTFRLRVRVAGGERDIQKVLHEIEWLRKIDAMGCKEKGSFDFMLESDRDTDVRETLFRQLGRYDLPLMMLRPMDMELEDIFLQLTDDEGVR